MIMWPPRIGNQRSPGISECVTLWVTLGCHTAEAPTIQTNGNTIQYRVHFDVYNVSEVFQLNFNATSADKSNMSPLIFMYNHVSESPCPGHPVSTLQNLIYDWQLIWRSQNTPMWPVKRDSVGKNSSCPIRLPADSLAPPPSVYLPPYASPSKTH